MEADLPTKLSCSVLGHNLMRSQTSRSIQTDLICKTCNSIVRIETNGNFSDKIYANQDIQNSIWDLFLKNRRLAKLRNSTLA